MALITVNIAGATAQKVEAGTTALDVLKAAAVLNNQVLAAKIDDQVVDLARPLTADCTVGTVPAESPEGLEVLRHSTAHLMAQAVKRLFPETQITIGPVISDGFYYDFKRDQPFTPDDLEKIEAAMKEIAKANLPVRREELPKADAIHLFRGMGEDFKAEIIDGIDAENVSLYRQGEFVDLCRGPHVPATGRLKAFKLTALPAPTGAATSATRCCSASMVRRGRARSSSRPT